MVYIHKLFLGIMFFLFEAIVSVFPIEKLRDVILFGQQKLFDIVVLKDLVFVTVCILLLGVIALIAFLLEKKNKGSFLECYAKVLGVFFLFFLSLGIWGYFLHSDWEDCMDYRGKWNEESQRCEDVPLLQVIY